MTAINPYEPPREDSQPVAVPGALPVRVTGILTADDAIATLRAMGKWRPWLAAFILIPLSTLAAFGLVLNRGSESWLAILIGFLLVSGVLAWTIFGGKRAVVAQWNSRGENALPVTWTFSEDGLFVETAHSKHLHAWSAFIHAYMTPDKLILTQQGGSMWNFIPRRFFATEGEWQAVAQLVAAKLPMRRIGDQ